MTHLKPLFFALLMTVSASAFGYGIGFSSYPLKVKDRLASAEFTGIFKDGGGVGLQGRFSYKPMKQVLVDAGAGISGGERSSRFFTGIDYEIFPDYSKQPRFSIKSTIERVSEFESKELILGFAPTISKGINIRGYEAFPYLAVPVGLGLETQTKIYKTRANVTIGVNGKLPFDDYKKFMGSFEGNINLKNSYTAVFLGVSYPL